MGPEVKIRETVCFLMFYRSYYTFFRVHFFSKIESVCFALFVYRHLPAFWSGLLNNSGDFPSGMPPH
jgi:hypothetical protein